MIARPPTGSNGLAISKVSGRNLVPVFAPPTKITALEFIETEAKIGGRNNRAEETSRRPKNRLQASKRFKRSNSEIEFRLES